MKISQRVQSIRMILSDVDGVLTDGSITYNNQGIETKSFHVRDGMGVKLWKRAGHEFGILTARTSHVVKLRFAELGVELVRQGVDDKLKAANQIVESLGIGLEEVCYVGDDLNDLAVLNQVGLAVSVADAAEEARKSAHLVTKAVGGRGAIRELVETILKSQKRWEELIESYA